MLMVSRLAMDLPYSEADEFNVKSMSPARTRRKLSIPVNLPQNTTGLG